MSIPFLPNHWYYNTESGQLTTGNNLLNLGNNLVGGVGWHELNIPGSATADQAAAEAKKEFPTGKTPTNQGLSKAVPQAVKAGVAAVPTAIGSAVAGAAKATGLGSVVDFLQGLTSANLWIRVAKVVAGGAILIVGLAKLTGADKTIGGVAAKAVKVAPLL